METDASGIVCKLVQRAEWEKAVRVGEYRGSADDLCDGFVHLSKPEQVAETARRHFQGQRDLLLVSFHVADLGDALRWERSRNQQLFPHYYGAIDVALAINAEPFANE